MDIPEVTNLFHVIRSKTCIVVFNKKEFYFTNALYFKFRDAKPSARSAKYVSQL